MKLGLFVIKICLVNICEFDVLYDIVIYIYILKK